MITRALYLALGWFVISFLATLLMGTRLRRGGFWSSLLWLLTVLLAGDAWAIWTFGVPAEIAALSAVSFFNGLFWISKLPNWNALGRGAWSTTLLATALFIVYSFSVIAFTPLNPLSFLLAAMFFVVETIALLLGLTHAYESLDVTCRIRWKRHMLQLMPIPGYTPKVSFHVPTYNEPPEVVKQTLQSLAALDYPNYEVLVIDNNTPDEKNWRSLQAMCRRLGARFRCFHLDRWPGFKSGALNFALAQTAPDAEIIGVVDADYQLEPNFLTEVVPAFRVPSIAFVQAPQDYRDYRGSAFAEAIYYGYRYFFEVSMPSRNEHNAIIFCGTMGLIRKSALQEIGGWDEWCITEDAEASLRILKRGYESVYIHKSYGRGLMPFTFEGLKKQRFRWCFGGIQILRKHWEALVPWARAVDPENRLTPAQRYFYLTGGLQWYTDALNLLFACFLVLGGLFSLFGGGLAVRPMVGPLLVIPAVFLLLNTWRFLWVLRHRLHLSIRKAMSAMYGFFSLGWAVTLASIQGLIQSKGIFLRTPKSRTQSRLMQALRVTLWETGIGLACALTGVAAFVAEPNERTMFLCALLVWQSGLFLAAPVYSVMSAYRLGAQPAGAADRGAPVREDWAARWAMGAVAAVLLVAAIVQFIPQPAVTNYAQFQPPEVPAPRLIGLEQVPVDVRDDTPAPTAIPPSPAPTWTPWPTAPFTPGVTVTVLPTPTLTLSPTWTITPTGTPSLTPTPTNTPLPTLTLTPTLLPTLAPSITPTLTLPPPPAATLTPTPVPAP